jgi:hypothetical protein
MAPDVDQSVAERITIETGLCQHPVADKTVDRSESAGTVHAHLPSLTTFDQHPCRYHTT